MYESLNKSTQLQHHHHHHRQLQQQQQQQQHQLLLPPRDGVSQRLTKRNDNSSHSATSERRLCRHCIAKHKTDRKVTAAISPSSERQEWAAVQNASKSVTADGEQSTVHFYDAFSYSRRRLVSSVASDDVVVDTWPGDQDILLISQDGDIRMALANEDYLTFKQSSSEMNPQNSNNRPQHQHNGINVAQTQLSSSKTHKENNSPAMVIYGYAGHVEGSRKQTQDILANEIQVRDILANEMASKSCSNNVLASPHFQQSVKTGLFVDDNTSGYSSSSPQRTPRGRSRHLTNENNMAQSKKQSAVKFVTASSSSYKKTVTDAYTQFNDLASHSDNDVN